MTDLLNIWVEKIRTNDASQVAGLYHREGLLLGTFSNIERKGHELILDYFKDLLSSQVDVKIITKHEYKAESISILASLDVKKEVLGLLILKSEITFTKWNESSINVLVTLLKEVILSMNELVLGKWDS